MRISTYILLLRYSLNKRWSIPGNAKYYNSTSTKKVIFLIHKYLQAFVSLRASLVVNIVHKLPHYGCKFKDLRYKGYI